MPDKETEKHLKDITKINKEDLRLTDKDEAKLKEKIEELRKKDPFVYR
jgi:hypothetical protein